MLQKLDLNRILSEFFEKKEKYWSYGEYYKIIDISLVTNVPADNINELNKVQQQYILNGKKNLNNSPSLTNMKLVT